MGLQTDLFVGTRDDASKYDGVPVNGRDRVQLGGLTNLEFETLWAIILDEEWDSARHRLEEVASTDESWTFRFPTAYVTAIKSLDAGAITKAAAEWAATDEIDALPSDVLPVIQSLVGLANSAFVKGRDLFVWTAL
jgi:hypothetical protein